MLKEQQLGIKPEPLNSIITFSSKKSDNIKKKDLEIDYLYAKLQEKETIINKLASHPFITEDMLDIIRDAAKKE